MELIKTICTNMYINIGIKRWNMQVPLVSVESVIVPIYVEHIEKMVDVVIMAIIGKSQMLHLAVL